MSPETARENTMQEEFAKKSFRGEDRIDKKINRALITNPILESEQSNQLLIDRDVSVTTEQQKSQEQHQHQQQKADVGISSAAIAEEEMCTEENSSSPLPSTRDKQKKLSICSKRSSKRARISQCGGFPFKRPKPMGKLRFPPYFQIDPCQSLKCVPV